ncbi:hypothetical protein BDN72DRAFT_851849 [Pluteus cervinus]|uniref:Uncharacterized protein n=1 Tax=Pluteus cervinus TaxID=181527 RepID=A0ACD2ZXK3_9AGAR|nr:hypothetical protein BDN72DRAFT_851849 [Pluteus cervinus]
MSQSQNQGNRPRLVPTRTVTDIVPALPRTVTRPVTRSKTDGPQATTGGPRIQMALSTSPTQAGDPSQLSSSALSPQPISFMMTQITPSCHSPPPTISPSSTPSPGDNSDPTGNGDTPSHLEPVVPSPRTTEGGVNPPDNIQPDQRDRR